MKKILIPLVVAFSATMVSCSKSFLDLTDPTKTATQDAYKDSISVSNGVWAAYNSLQQVYGKNATYRGIFQFADVTSDDTYTGVVDGSAVYEFEYFKLQSTNSNIQKMWEATYQLIARANIILGRIGNVPMGAPAKNVFIGEMKFLRALAYFNAVRIWGEVPLVTTEIENIQDAYAFGRKPVEEVYNQIISDLNDAIAVLPLPSGYTAANAGRATKPAAEGLLAKVYLTKRDYAKTAEILKSFVEKYDKTVFSLQPKYADVFSTTNEMNSEIVFAVRYKRGGLNTGSPFYNLFGPVASNIIKVGTGQQLNFIRKDLYDSMAVNGTADTRRDASIGINGTTYYCLKYMDPAPTGNLDAENDWIVLRYADILLMYAEALNELSGGNVSQAIDYVNMVRNRAGAAQLDAAAYSQQTLRSAILNERRFELNAEGHRWFDLVRTGNAVSVMNNHFKTYGITYDNAIVQIDEHNLLFPLPLVEINTNPILTQNPGYN
jgi:hypothetical protein